MTLTIAIVVATLALLRCFALEKKTRRQARRIANLTRLVSQRASR